MIASALAGVRPIRRIVRSGLIATLVAGNALLVPLAQALDFQLHTIKTLDDGFTHEHGCFSYDEHSDMLIDLPRGWTTTADSGSITCVAPNASAAMIRIEKSAVAPNVAFHDNDLEQYRRRVLSGVPEGAVNTRIVAEKADPLPIFGWKDYEFTLAYDFFGQSLRRSVAFINLNPKQQITVTIVATQSDFDTVHGQGMTVMQSWVPTPAK